MKKEGKTTEETKETRQEVKKLALIYALSLVGFGVTILAGMPLARLFDWAGYGQMRGFFKALFTGLLWMLELGLLRLACALLLKRKIFRLTEHEKELLPGNRIAWITVIVVVIIMAVSIQTGFRVKLVYDIGEKVTGYELFEKLAIIFLNIMKMVWLVFLFRLTEAMFPDRKGLQGYLVLLLAAVPLAALDIGIFGISLPLTYGLMYLVFPLIYLMVERNHVKSLLLQILLYLL